MGIPAALPPRFVVLPDQIGLRLDQFLAQVTTWSRRKAREILSDGVVLRNGRTLRVASRSLELGDVIEIEPRAGAEPRRTASLPPVEIVFEDRSLVVGNKPAGLLSQPAEDRQPGELAFDELLLCHLALRDGQKPFLRLVHRIDRTTSGLLLFARAPEALPPLAEAWQSGAVERRYLAVIEGVPPFDRTTIEAPIGRVDGGAWKFEVAARGLPATTEVRVLRRGASMSEVECRLVTGRTHQVRVHLAHLGFPVLGDRRYGARHFGMGRPLLHAAALSLPHPATGMQLEVRAELPPDWMSIEREVTG